MYQLKIIRFFHSVPLCFCRKKTANLLRSYRIKHEGSFSRSCTRCQNVVNEQNRLTRYVRSILANLVHSDHVCGSCGGSESGLWHIIPRFSQNRQHGNTQQCAHFQSKQLGLVVSPLYLSLVRNRYPRYDIGAQRVPAVCLVHSAKPGLRHFKGKGMGVGTAIAKLEFHESASEQAIVIEGCGIKGNTTSDLTERAELISPVCRSRQFWQAITAKGAYLPFHYLAARRTAQRTERLSNRSPKPLQQGSVPSIADRSLTRSPLKRRSFCLLLTIAAMDSGAPTMTKSSRALVIAV